MRYLRVLSLAFLSFVFPLLAGTAAAQNVKYFTLGAPTSVSVSTTTIDVTFKNVDNGNSSFNSLGIKGTLNGSPLTITTAVVLSPFGPGTQAPGSGGFTFVTGLSPVKKTQTATVRLTVQLTGSGCNNGEIVWEGRAFTGSPSQPSTEFQQQNINPPVKTTVTMACSYSATGTVPPSMAKGTTQDLAITVSNAAASTASISAISLTPPAGVAVNSATSLNVAPGASGVVTVNAKASCAASGSGGSWITAVTGFTRTGGEPSTSVTGACSVAVTGAPSSIIPGQGFTLVVEVRDGAGNPIAGYGGTVTLSVGTGCTLTGTSSGGAANGVATLSGVSVSVDSGVASCGVTAKATVDGAEFTSAAKSLTVFNGQLGCSTSTFDSLNLPADVGTPGAFDASAGDAAIPGDTAFIAGIRGSDPDKGVCSNANGDVKVNYAVVNNILPGGSPQTDPLLNTVHVGTYSVTWDPNQVDPISGQLLKPVFAVVVTLQGEWGAAATGLPTRNTLVCIAAPCLLPPSDGSGNINAGWKPMPACTSTMVKHSSIPAGEKACLASERWDVAPTSDCTGSPPAGSVPAEGRCLKPTSIIIMGDDPVIGRPS